jgi:hypothetical protein
VINILRTDILNSLGPITLLTSFLNIDIFSFISRVIILISAHHERSAGRRFSVTDRWRGRRHNGSADKV